MILMMTRQVDVGVSFLGYLSSISSFVVCFGWRMAMAVFGPRVGYCGVPEFVRLVSCMPEVTIASCPVCWVSLIKELHSVPGTPQPIQVLRCPFRNSADISAALQYVSFRKLQVSKHRFEGRTDENASIR
jgi:hypothetical protein